MEGKFCKWDAEEVERVAACMRQVLASPPPGLVLAYLHGSFVRGPFYEDIDVALLVDRAASTAGTPSDLWEALGRCAPRGVEVDARIIDGAAPAFTYEVVRDGRCLFARTQEERVAFESRAVLVWLDFAPRFEEGAKAMRREIIRRWGPALARMTG